MTPSLRYRKIQPSRREKTTRSLRSLVIFWPVLSGSIIQYLRSVRHVLTQYHENISNDSTSERQRTSDVIEIFEWFGQYSRDASDGLILLLLCLIKPTFVKKAQFFQKIIRIKEQHQSIANCFTRDLSFTGRRYRRELQRTPALWGTLAGTESNARRQSWELKWSSLLCSDAVLWSWLNFFDKIRTISDKSYTLKVQAVKYWPILPGIGFVTWGVFGYCVKCGKYKKILPPFFIKQVEVIGTQSKLISREW